MSLNTNQIDGWVPWRSGSSRWSANRVWHKNQMNRWLRRDWSRRQRQYRGWVL